MHFSSASSVLSLKIPTFGSFFLLVVFFLRTYQGAWSDCLPACNFLSRISLLACDWKRLLLLLV